MKNLFTSYYAKSGRHPLAVSITAVQPRWCTISRSCPELSPTWSLVDGYKRGAISREEYTRLYLELLDYRAATSKPAGQIVDQLPEGAVLLCYERTGSFCHRHLAAEWLMKHARVKILEL